MQENNNKILKYIKKQIRKLYVCIKSSIGYIGEGHWSVSSGVLSFAAWSYLHE